VLVLGILGLVFCGLLGPIAWIKGNAATRDIKARPDLYTDSGQVRAGRILGMIGTILLAIAAFAVIIVTVATMASREGTEESVSANTAVSDTPTTEAEAARDLQWQGPVIESVGDVPTRIAAEVGVFIWSDFDGWHVRSTLDDPVTVTVTADAIVELSGSGEATDETVSGVTATIEPGDGTEGLDLDLGFSTSATFSINVDGDPLPANEIKLGGSGQAEQNPVSFAKG
jgi:hypothetical protein